MRVLSWVCLSMQWVAACRQAGGGEKCTEISVTAFSALLASGNVCDQQDAADTMVTFAKTLNSDPDMIRLAQIFAQQPRNAPDSLQVPYCQTAPKNAELNGFFQCQFQGTVASGKFSGDQTGNIPLGVSAVNPPGSCPASNTPIADGQQLNTLVNSPGSPAGDVTAAAPAPTNSSAAAPAGADNGIAAPHSIIAGSSVAIPAASVVALPATAPTVAALASPSDPSKAFLLSNGQQAQKLNAQFATLTASSPCSAGEQACVQGAFAQCINGTFVSTPCAEGTQCFALPLVNEAGTTNTCTTSDDAAARIAATGVSGGVSGA